ncbi:MAG: 2-oxo acid dehydrogenase subunit E2 [Victivallales bacterium]|nr:2-oxo acid dehydrogenase subunit E2 [Victivallales bacterium]
MATAIVMPKAGNSVEECFLSKWNIKVGDTVKKGDIIATAETDKTSVEVEATEGGTVLALFAEEGQLVPVLTTICAVGAPGEDASALAPKGAAPAAAPAAPAPAAPAAPATPAAPAAPAKAAPATAHAIVMPKAGNSVEECFLSKWNIKVGDVVKKGDIIATAETDKTSVEVEATEEGTVLALFVEEGALVPVLSNICAVGNPGDDPSAFAPGGAAPAPAAAPAASAPAAAPAVATPAAPAAAPAGAANGPMSPRARKFVAEHPFVVPAIVGSGAQGRIMECDVAAAYQTAPHLTPAAAAMVAAGAKAPATGTGSNGEITVEDIENFAKGIALAATPAPAAAPKAAAPAAPAPAAGEDVITEKPFSRIRTVIAKRLLDSLQTMAQYTLNAEADVTGLLNLRKKIKANGEKLGLANINIGDMVMYAVIKSLQQVPEMNGEFSDNVVKLHSAVNMGFACDTPKGLLVPVLHHSDKMSLAEMCKQVKALAKAANAGTLAPDLMNGATFTVSNLGSFGIVNFTPVISAPQIAMLGVGKTLLRPVRQADGTVAYRDYMQFSLTINHMVVDGAPAARFLQALTANIENFELICIAK